MTRESGRERRRKSEKINKMTYGEISDICSDAVLSVANNGQSAAKFLIFYNTKLIILEKGSTTIAKASRVTSDW